MLKRIFKMSDSDCSTLINESAVDLEKVTIWYRCAVCSCYLFSIPALKKHSLNAHNIQSVELPKNPLPGALQGKIYYTYDTVYNQIPQPYPFKARNEWTHDELIEKLEGVRKPLEIPFSLPERDFSIRVKELKDLIDSSSSGDENDKEPTNQAKNSSNPSPLDSPPDSGIHGSECHDDERQQPVAPVPVEESSEIPNQVYETSCNYLGSNEQEPSSGSTKVPNVENPPKRKLPCTLCDKKFNNVSSLNFHTKKFHPDGNPEKNVSPDKVILTIQRDGTGNFSSKPGRKSKPQEIHTEEDDSNKQQVRARKRSISSDTSKVTSTFQENQPEPLKTRLRHSRENSQTGNKKQKKSSYYNDDEYNPAPSSNNKNWQKCIVSDREESENESDVSEATPPTAKKNTNVGGRKKTRQSDIQDSPIAKNTRRSSRLISPSSPESEVESSTSELEISDDEEKSDSGDSDDAEELTEKSTTSEDSISPPALTDYGSDDDDLFTPIITKRKKQKVPKEKQDGDKREQLPTKPAKRSRPANENASIHSSPASEVSSIHSKPSSEFSSKNSKVNSGKKESGKKCSLCSMEYKDPSSFIQHLYKAHKGKKMYFNCGLCEKRFSTDEDISVFNKHIIEEKKALLKKQKNSGKK